MQKLRELFEQNEGLRTIKYLHYMDVYEAYFRRYLGKPVNILELGVYEGGSLELYQKYFGENCNVFGVDILPQCQKIETLIPNCKMFIGDTGNVEFLDSLMDQLPLIDIVIDDAGHKTSQQITAFQRIFPRINDNGVYLCEDLHTNYWKDYIDTDKTFTQYLLERMELINSGFFKEDGRTILLKDELFTNHVKSVYFANSIAVIEKRPADMEFGHKRTGNKDTF